jgi:hypothetical protein
MRSRTRYVIRSAEGGELVCPSLADLCALYDQGFVGDDDLVRPESSQRWVRAAALPGLRTLRERRKGPGQAALFLAVAIIVALAAAILLRGLH